MLTMMMKFCNLRKMSQTRMQRRTTRATCAAALDLSLAVAAGRRRRRVCASALTMAAITDSKAGFDIINNVGVTKHSTHFLRRLHFAREMVLRNEAHMYLERSEYMMADADTKVVTRDKFLMCRAFKMNLASGMQR